VGEQKYRLRPPGYLDIDLTGDGHGHHIPGSPIIFHHGWKLVSSEATTAKQAVRQRASLRYRRTHTISVLHGDARTLERGEIRKTFKMTHDQRELLFNAAGLHMEFHEDDVTLIEQWHESNSATVRAKIQHELEVRQMAVQTGLKTIKEADTLARRQSKRRYLHAFDDKMSQTKMGKAILKIRDKIESDRAFDNAEKFGEAVKEYGKDWATHLATSRTVQMLVGVAVGLSSHLLGGSGTPEAIQKFMENPVAETGVAAAVSIAIGLGVKAARKLAKGKPKPLEDELLEE
jgi:hypothetical protein